MRAVVQRVTEASVVVDGETVGAIGQGLLLLVSVEDGDTEADVRYTVDKCATLRIFNDERGRFHHSVEDLNGAVLVVSQFTLHGDCRKGRRPSFTGAARPETAKALYEAVAEGLRARGLEVATGRFGADMKVRLLNDGPVTLLLDSRKAF